MVAVDHPCPGQDSLRHLVLRRPRARRCGPEVRRPGVCRPALAEPPGRARRLPARRTVARLPHHSPPPGAVDVRDGRGRPRDRPHAPDPADRTARRARPGRCRACSPSGRARVRRRAGPACMSERFDAYVVGAGPAGTVCAGELADGGLKVGLAERELVGGECSFWACIPSKTLLRPGEALAGARHAPGAREAITASLDAAAAFEWRDFQVSDHDDEKSASAAPWVREKGIALHRGDAKITAPGRITVGDVEVETERIVIATGSAPIIPPVDGLADVPYWTNREGTALEELPASIVVLGGGPVGVELAQALRRLGAEVSIVEGKRLLAREGEQAGAAIGKQLERDGIALHLGVHAKRVTEVERPGGSGAGAPGSGIEVELDDGARIRAERILVATGRRPRIADIGLEGLGLDLESGHLEVDNHLRTKADNVWAIGDVTGVALFTHVGKCQARIAAADILGKEARADYRALPRVTFSDPQVAGAGMTEEQARATGIQLAIGRADIGGIARTSTYTRDYDELDGFLILLADRRRSVLVGAYAVGPEAGEWLQQATLAIRAEVSIHVLRDTIQPFPTFSEIFVNALADLDA